MKRMIQVLLVLAAIGVNVTLVAANVNAASVPGDCPGWRACQCANGGDLEDCCVVCTTTCNGCKVPPPLDQT